MRPKRWSIVYALSLVALTLIFTSSARAQPKYKVLATIDGGLWSGLTFDSKGNLYGVTTGGGDSGVGSIFEMTRNSRGGWTVTTLHSFDGTDGSSPNGGLIFDEAGNLYGTSPDGGAYDFGTVFELTPGSDGWTFTVIHNFCAQYGCPDGEGPSAGLVRDKGGNLYGTAGGGSYGWGVAFELTSGSSGWNETVLHSFAGPPNDGGAIYAPLTFGGAGSLYGVTAEGGRYLSGNYGDGAVFKLTPKLGGGWGERVLFNFDGGDGQGPTRGLLFDKSGNLYGTTAGGGESCLGGFCGTTFKLTRTSAGRWVHSVLYDFAKPQDGFEPITGVVSDIAGNLYGTTATGGTGSCFDGCGVVYKLTPDADGKWIYTVVHEFSGPSESPPDGTLIIDPKGNLYGTAFSVAFEITP
ncbi:MAG TPA: choice-of-anchor tandem repeat GloVer-containing protein [Terriglobales bacterium]|nr:choice-of-anchor tandem repeat GloVer-containing protein [Terriglobales bacterium]